MMKVLVTLFGLYYWAQLNSDAQITGYPYCNNIFSPSIPCNQRFPNGTWMDGNRASPTEACANYFFMCSSGQSYCFNCPRDKNGDILYYNHPVEQCDYPDNIAACSGQPPTNPPTPTTTSTTTTTTTTPTTTTTTPTTTTTTPTTTTTTPPSTTTQPIIVIPTITPPGGGETFGCPADKPNGFFHIPNTCGPDYFVCLQGIPYISTCPVSNGVQSIFDPKLLICVLPSSASCNPFNFVCPTQDGFYAIPGQCTGQHNICIGGEAFVQTCPGTALFDPIQLVCVPPEQASCNPSVG